MTFDLVWATVPPELEEKTQKAFNRALEAKGAQQALLFEEFRTLQVQRFGCNNWFMHRLTLALNSLGMVNAGFKHSPFTGNEEQDEMVVQEFNREDGRPPLGKFGSNDGWLVSPAEIDRALSIYEALPEGSRKLVLDIAFDMDKDSLERWEEFIQFWRDARDHGGFKVW